MSPIEMSFLGDLIEICLLINNEFTLPQMDRFVQLGCDCRRAEKEFKGQREAWRKERRS